MKDDNPFQGRRLWIVTQHQKERVIAPILRKRLGLVCMVFTGINTDQFGTFSGEVARQGSALDAARAKCRGASALLPPDLILTSEGSFGPHPHIPFVYCNEELLLLTDTRESHEWKITAVTTRTNFGSAKVESESQLIDFALKAGFPSHALILRSVDGPKVIIKGINSWSKLKYHFRKLLLQHPVIQAETDMRAMFNPLRMEFIGKATRELANLLLRKCPKCQTPGYSVTDVIRGLPCSWCGEPTSSVLANCFTCSACGCKTEKYFPFGKQTEDPMYCHSCNP
ncbi:MAG: hypothetical protein NZM13_12740 [Cyclobacteriaceae bacterium]|nr:hypothetical protein [Cyclobacteriaceae bacterium]MDW8330609.1 hypothetical protein [Cyclobacteriaceae bacterium]